ncbi:MAG: 4Fe-4S binding protein [Acidobacteria bacterium]|nr:4Fe-4S binding protein [Acidobacteriota bacterium]
MDNHSHSLSLWCRLGTAVAAVVLLLSAPLAAQYQMPPPDFGESYSLPTQSHPEPPSGWVNILDVALLASGLGLAAWLILKKRSRRGVVLLSIGALAYFGFYRQGCICPIGSIQNVALSIADPDYMISFGVLAFFFLPLAAALLFGRVFCGGVCPLGAVQDLVLLWPKKIPRKLDRVLGILPYVYLAAAVYFAIWSLRLTGGEEGIVVARRFLICEWDPFVGLFRIAGSFHMLALGAVFIIGGMFIGRPYCRWLCPYGGILSILSRFAWKNVKITPGRELDCGLCAEACPFGAIAGNRADRGACLSCARCYDSCPLHSKRVPGLVTIAQGPGRNGARV